VDRDEQETADYLRQRIPGNEPIGEHEGKSPIVAQGFEAGPQTEIRCRVIRIVEAAHSLVDEAEKIGNAERRGRMDRYRCGDGALARVVAACTGDRLFQTALVGF